MKHNLKVMVEKENLKSGIVACRHLTVREKLLNYLLGNPVKLTIIVPGNGVEEVAITEVPERGRHEAV